MAHLAREALGRGIYKNDQRGAPHVFGHLWSEFEALDDFDSGRFEPDSKLLSDSPADSIIRTQRIPVPDNYS